MSSGQAGTPNHQVHVHLGVLLVIETGESNTDSKEFDVKEPVSTQSTTPDHFAALGLSADLCRTVRDAGYSIPTPIQTEAIGHVLAGKDLLGCAQTGTGKTAAFALPILQNLMASDRGKGRDIRCLVLAPTRELAAQIGASFEKYAGRGGPRQRVVFGGVGTPGTV